MLKAFLFVVAIVTNSGEVQMRAINVEACPEEVAFTAAMDNLKDKGEMKEWNAMCIKLPAQGQDS